MLFSEFRAIINKAPGRHEFYVIKKKLETLGILPNDSPLLESLDDEEISWIAPDNSFEMYGVEYPVIFVTLLEDKVID